MKGNEVSAARFGRELAFTTSRSGGPGGQNVNKVNTKVTLKFDVKGSRVLSESEKEVLTKKLASRLTADGLLILSSQDKRSQLQNKESVIGKFERLLVKALERRKPRRATKPSKVAVQKRLNQKKRQSDKKIWRQKPK